MWTCGEMEMFKRTSGGLCVYVCVSKTCELGIHSHPIYTSTGDVVCTCNWGYPKFKKGFKTIKKGMYYPPRDGRNSLLDLGVLSPLALVTNRLHLPLKSSQLCSWGYTTCITSPVKLGTYPPLYIYNTHIVVA